MINPYSIAGTVLVLVALTGAWRAWWMQAAESGFMDRELRRAGHVPPETDPERTLMIPTVRPDEDLAHGEHSLGREGARVGAVYIVRGQDGALRFLRTIGDGPLRYESRHHLVGVS